MMPIEQMREKVDAIDVRIVRLLEERVDLARKIGEAKRKNNLPMRDLQREQDVLIRVTEKTRLNKGFVKKLFEGVMEYCRENE
ncbi:MAG: chorismate mutase [Candidatus Altiarchaeota archaeon]